MELKKYQRRVLGDLRDYLDKLDVSQDAAAAFKDYWAERGVRVGGKAMPAYSDTVEGAPHVCFKVPTGGGKTFLACNSIKPIFEHADYTKAKAVVWLVPSDPILEQTLKNLRDVSHPYRQRIDADFGGRVEIYTKQQLLAGQNFNPASVYEQLSIFVLSYDSFRTSKKDGRKAYQENSSLLPFSDAFGESGFGVEGADETALIQVINRLHPLVIVDESHHAKSTLSVEMLNNFNPCFVLDLTATPAHNSNVISFVDAIELKAERMVKLPVIVYNRNSKEDVIADAIDFRQNLEDAARRDADALQLGIRPIVLFQAQPKGKEDSTTFERLRDNLVEFGIPAEQIAIKTADVNELKHVDLADPACPVRFIITVNALKEGWDCPNAYILATLANRTSHVDVEQIVGRILRQPHTRFYGDAMLNMCYVLTSSVDFQDTVSRVIAGLNNAGFSEKDYRAADEGMLAELEELGREASDAGRQTTLQFVGGPQDAHAGEGAPADGGAPVAGNAYNDEEFLEFDGSKVRDLLDKGEVEERGGIADMRKIAEDEAMSYDRNTRRVNYASFGLPDELMSEGFHMKPEFAETAGELVIPQFFKKVGGNLFCETDEVPLTQDHLLQDFSLRGKDSEIDFESIDFDMYKLDIERGGRVTTSKLMGQDYAYIRHYFSTLAPERRVEACKGTIHGYLNRDDSLDSRELTAYIDRIVGDMTGDELAYLERYPNVFAKRIQDRIEEHKREHCRVRFDQEIERAGIICKPSWKLPDVINPTTHLANPVAKSLYENEETVNGLELNMMMSLSGLENIVWWHRNIARRGFTINGISDHYPDFMAYTTGGRLILIETKGNHLDNPKTRAKLRMGRQWHNATPDAFRYYMVFDQSDPKLDGAYHINDFLKLLRDL